MCAKRRKERRVKGTERVEGDRRGGGVRLMGPCGQARFKNSREGRREAEESRLQGVSDKQPQTGPEWKPGGEAASRRKGRSSLPTLLLWKQDGH